MTKAITLRTAFLKALQAFTIIFAILMVYAVMPLHARAAALTDTQMQSITSLLASFGTEPAVIENVQLALSGASKQEVL